MQKPAKNGKTVGLYIHIPFCRSKCEYCDFYSLGGSRDRTLMDQYLQALCVHLRESAGRAQQYEVDSVYFGGGTPTFFGADGLKRILAEIYKRYDVTRNAEISLEANPDSVTSKDLSSLYHAGFNRISLGVQSDQDEFLKALGRPHTYAQAVQAVSAAREAGFDNVSVDLMYGLPNQTKEQWMQTLHTVTSLKPEHISCYGLKVEPGTPLYSYKDCANLPDDDMQADMYLYTVEMLESFGYNQYEISNFAKEGFECFHNLKYWLGDEYLGFGPSASSDFAGKRFTCAPDIRTYIDGVLHGGVVLSECDTIPLRERAGEYLMLRLRTSVGIEEEEYVKAFLLSFRPLERLLQKLAEQGMSIYTDGRWRLTAKGFLLSNQIIGALLDAQQTAASLGKRI